MNNTISLDIDHREKTRVEYFLNSVNGNLEQVPFDGGELSHIDDIFAGFKFKDADRSTFITVIFTSSYYDAVEISKANSLTRPNIRWTINGAILFGVESVDEDVSSELLGHFAGRE
jgi:hypothetical protein